MGQIEFKNKWVVITGASSGIGKAYAEELAQRAANLILVARSTDRLNELASQLRTKHRVQVDVITADLSKTESPIKVYEEVKSLGRQIFGLINNAGFAVYGEFHKSPLERNQQEILLNVFALASLTQLFIRDMADRSDGVILNIASTAAFQPVPYMANYGASKAFVLSFTEALWAEYQGSGIKILTVCPGSTDTAFFDVVAAEEASVGKRDTPENVVMSSLVALEKNQSHVITGPFSNYLLSQLGRILPRAMVAKTAKNIMKPKKALPQIR